MLNEFPTGLEIYCLLLIPAFVKSFGKYVILSLEGVCVGM